MYIRLTRHAAYCLAAFASLAATDTARSQSANDNSALSRSLSAWIALPSAPGRDVQLAERLVRALHGWTTDARGNLLRRTGSGSPRRVVACALDIPQYVVSEITIDGYLRLHRAGNAFVQHPLWDQFHEAQRIRVLTRRGERAGVVAVANGHFARQHRGDTTITWVDQLWVDVGAVSRAQVQSLGISLLDPVLADRPAWDYEGFAAGPAAGARASCAAVAAAANGTPSSGETTWVLSTQRAFGWVGLSGILAHMGKIDALTLVDAGSSAALDTRVALARVPSLAIRRTATADSIQFIAPKVRYAGSFVESIHADDARALLARVAQAGDVALPSGAWPAPPLDTARVLAPRGDAFADAERMFMTLADIPGVPGHEGRVRSAILSLMPEWARRRAVVDSIGNIIVAAGPDRDSVAFMAHMDEVSFEVEQIAGDGVVSLGRRGGPVVTAWEGQTALLHFDPDATGRAPESLRGVFVPRDSARTKQPGTLTAWFGMDSAQLVAHGVRKGLGVTSYKRAGRLAGTRITGRASDDRTGSTALLLAARALDPATFTRKVIFVWSVQEEVGLFGAREFATHYGASLARVYSIDTFVSSDTPLELPTFALAPLGSGVVMRGLDDAAMSPMEEMDRVQRVARAAGVPLQIGTTHGGTDGSAIAVYGAPNVGLSWPGRYSHSPGEVLDLRDVSALAHLIRALAAER
ncbi:MAG: M20/M25/M40 family metallo-hydrolase [Gemmatimonadaceae bacterium]